MIKIKSSIEEPLELELKGLPKHLEYAFLEQGDKLPLIIARNITRKQKVHLIQVLKRYKRDIAWKITNIKVINFPSARTKSCLKKIANQWCNPKEG
jgi:hypothetical protein